jgi:3-phosphoshikimate 1-carboxyvinyltransferase
MAMSAAIAALRANGPVTIHQAESVKKSFPDFFNALISLGATVSLTH